MNKVIAVLMVGVFTACASTRVSDDGSRSISCSNFLFCKLRISTQLQESKKKWAQFNLKNYFYTLDQWYADEPPNCSDVITVHVKSSLVHKAEVVSCSTKQRTIMASKELKGIKTMNEMYDYCQKQVLGEAPLFANLYVSFDKKGILSHCHFYKPYWGRHTGGNILYKE